MNRIVVKQGEIGAGRIEAIDAGAIGEGEVRARIDAFALTANNVTYAAMGKAMRYWDFFPANDGDGVVPVWGYAHVTESAVEGIEVGERLYGYWPMASEIVLKPAKISAGGFTDASAHRAHLASVYNQYRRLNGDAGHDAAQGATGEAVRMVFEPLFLTSFLIEGMFARDGWHGATQMVMTSASSKTAMALAHVARAKAPHIRRIGLTSAGNKAFVESTGLYDLVLGYDEIGSIPVVSSVSVDFAGNGAVLRQVHEALGDALHYSCLVGLTHWDERGSGGGDMPGPKPALFFAPDHVAATIAELGPGGFAAAKDACWIAFAKDAAALIDVATIEGLEAAIPAWRDLVDGKAAADKALVVQI